MSVLPARILLATDGSEDAAEATAAAVDLARRSDSELHLVHVWHDVPSAYADIFIREGLKEQGREILDEQAREIEALGGAVAGEHLREGRTSDEVIALSDELGADLLIIGRRGLGPVQRLLLGSHSEDIVHRAHVPVLVLRRGENLWPPRSVVAGDDYSEDAMRAAGLAAAIGNLFGIRAKLVHAYPPQLEESKEMLERAGEDLGRRATELESVMGYRPKTEMLAGDAAVQLLEAAGKEDDPALIAIGSRGLGAMGRMRLGSISTKVVRAAPGPVLVCPHVEKA